MKTKNLLFTLMIIVFPLLSFSEVEPNNDYAHACPLGLNTTDNGIANVSTDMYDWWQITIPSDGQLVISTTSDAPPMELDLYMYDINGTYQIASGAINGINESMQYTSLMPGTYFVKVLCYAGIGSYTITSVFTPASLPNDTENNDTYSTAATLPLNGSSTGHLHFYTNGYFDTDDWWKVTIPSEGQLIINTTSDATLELDLSMYDVNGTTQITFDGNGSGIYETTQHSNLVPGIYFIRAKYFSGYGTYTISSTFNPLTQIGDIDKPSPQITVFPNPVSDKIIVYSSGKIDAIEIYSILGGKVYTASDFAQQTTNEIDLSDFKNGIYFLKIFDGADFYTEKIIKR